MLRPGVLQQHVSVPAALQELAAAEQGVVTHLGLTHEALQAVHVLDGLQSSGGGSNKGSNERERKKNIKKQETINADGK